MTIDQFSNSFDRLVDSFNPSKPDKKAKIYFEFLRNFDGNLFLKVCNKIISENDRMPTIAQIKEQLSAIQNSENGLKKKEKCFVCDGFGFVSIWKHTFRGRCVHGDRLSHQISKAPVTYQDREFWVEVLEKQNLELYGKQLNLNINEEPVL